MSQSEEYQNLARKFVDVWQEQMAAMLNDGDFIRSLLKMMQGNAFTKDFSHANPFTGQQAGGAAAASDARDAALASLAYSLAAIEKRLERLEHVASEPVKPGRRKAAKSVVRTTRRPKTRKSSRAGVKKKSR